MMTTWSEQAAQRAADAEAGAALRLQKEERDCQLIEAVDFEMFDELNRSVSRETDSFNCLRGKKVLETTFARPLQRNRERIFTVSRFDGQRTEMKFGYLQNAHRLRCEFGDVKKEFRLAVGSDGEVRFQTLNREARTIEAIGREMLELYE